MAPTTSASQTTGTSSGFMNRTAEATPHPPTSVHLMNRTAEVAPHLPTSVHMVNRTAEVPPHPPTSVHMVNRTAEVAPHLPTSVHLMNRTAAPHVTPAPAKRGAGVQPRAPLASTLLPRLDARFRGCRKRSFLLEVIPAEAGIQPLRKWAVICSRGPRKACISHLMCSSRGHGVSPG